MISPSGCVVFMACARVVLGLSLLFRLRREDHVHLFAVQFGHRLDFGELFQIVGEKEEAEGLVSVRAQGEGDKGQMTLEAFRDYMTDLVSHEIDANKMEQKN